MHGIGPHAITRLRLPATCLAAALAVAVPAAPVTSAEPEGFDLYVEHCSTCHGVYGEGDGIMAPDLAVMLKDLRHLSARNGGRFPREYVVDVIDGRAVRAAHGPEGMPVWGAVFAREPAADGAPARGETTITTLVDFLESLQIE